MSADPSPWGAELIEQVTRAWHNAGVEFLAPDRSDPHTAWLYREGLDEHRTRAAISAVLAHLREPTPEMVAAILPLAAEPHADREREIGIAALALMPRIPSDKILEAIDAARDLVRDMTAMIDQARKEIGES